jgi:hypothetical protein
VVRKIFNINQQVEEKWEGQNEIRSWKAGELFAGAETEEVDKR